MSLRRSLAALTLLLALLPLPARAGFYTEAFCRPKDFALVKHQGLYHVFYIRHREYNVPPELNETDLGHAVSPDLLEWTILEPVLPARPGSWDRTHVWAPSIVRMDDLFYMFYTGVSTDPGFPLTQSIGVATSPDLMEWTRTDAPVFTLAQVPWAWADTTTNRAAFRDPFVMPDPADPGRWLMYYTAVPRADTLAMVVGVAGSDDLWHWSDRGPLWATHVTATSGDSTTESPHLFAHDGTWYLFYSAYATTQLRWLTSADPLGGPEAWTYHGDVTAMFPGESWVANNYASEFLSDGLLDYFAYCGPGTIEFRLVHWGTDGAFVLGPPNLRHVVSMTWDRAAAAEHDSLLLTCVTANADAEPVPLEAVHLRPDGSEVPLDPAALGLPASLRLADTTRMAWRARWLPDPRDSTGPLRLVLRLAERTCAAAPLTIAPQPPLELVSMRWEPDTVAYDGRATLALVARHTVLRAVPLEAALGLGAETVPITPHAAGLPDTLALAGDTTRVSWEARWFAEPADTGRTVVLPDEVPLDAAPMRLVVRPAGGEPAGPTLTVLPPGPRGALTLSWDADTVAGDGVARLAIVAANGRGRAVALEATRVVGPGPVPVAPADLGLPASLPLTGDTTTIAWPARWLADPGDTLRPMTLSLRVAGGGPEAPPLVVERPEALVIRGLSWSQDTVAHDSTVVLSLAALHWRWRWVTLRTGRIVNGLWSDVPPESLGLPARVELTGEVTRVPWCARWLAAPPDTTAPLALGLGLAEAGAQAQRLLVRPPEFQVLALCWDSARVTVGHPAVLSVAARHWRWRTVALEGWALAGGELPVSLPALGLPEALLLTADTTRVAWTAALPPGDSALVLRVRIGAPGAPEASVAVVSEGARPAAVARAAPPREGLRLMREGREWALAASLRESARAARIDLYDTQGRHVRRLHAGPLSAGTTRVGWDGRTDAGTASPPGLYFARLVTPRLVATARLIRLR